MEKISLILEGGTFRSIFTAGVLDNFLQRDINFPYVIGVSAGALNACSYLSQQQERTFRTIATYRHDPRYMGMRNFITEKSYFGLNFSYNVLPNEIDLFDWETYRNFDGEAEFGVTNAITGDANYLNALTMDKECMMLRATCALPLLFPEIKLDDVPYYDGGLADAVPIKRAEEKGCTKHVIILTRPPGYRKKIDGEGKLAITLLRKRYPAIATSITTRAKRYNATMDYIEQLERDGKAIVFRPPLPLNSFEKDRKIMKITYDLGYRQMNNRAQELHAFMQE